MISAVTNGKGTIGYADESQAGSLGKVKVKVGDAYVEPSAEGAAKVVAISKPAEGRSDVDMAVDLDRTTTEAGAYPVVLLSYLIACQTYDDASEAALVKAYLELRDLQRGPGRRREERRLGSPRLRGRRQGQGDRREDRGQELSITVQRAGVRRIRVRRTPVARQPKTRS